MYTVNSICIKHFSVCPYVYTTWNNLTSHDTKKMRVPSLSVYHKPSPSLPEQHLEAWGETTEVPCPLWYLWPPVLCSFFPYIKETSGGESFSIATNWTSNNFPPFENHPWTVFPFCVFPIFLPKKSRLSGHVGAHRLSLSTSSVQKFPGWWCFGRKKTTSKSWICIIPSHTFVSFHAEVRPLTRHAGCLRAK